MSKVKNKIITSIVILILIVLGSCFVSKSDYEVLANSSDSISQEMLSALSVKCQVKENTDGSADLRLVSTVDALAPYGTAGFYIYVEENGVTELLEKYERPYVTDKIGAKEEGVSFEYNPKVFDTISNYFITVTVTGIPQSDFGNGFLIKPFVTMSDNPQQYLYGESRYVKINDAIEGKEYLSVPVSKLDATTGFSVKVGDTTYSSDIEFYNDATNDSNYTHVRVKLDSAELSSLTKVSVLDASSSEVTGTKYRNLYSKTSDADTTWYTNAEAGTTEYVLATKADLYGFASLVNVSSVNFDDKIVHLGADIVVNTIPLDPDADVYSGDTSKWSTAVAGCKSWDPIGAGTDHKTNKAFAGTFDGQNQTISGLYFDSDGYYLGLFGMVATDGSTVVRNLKLTNSYFKARYEQNYAYGLGSIIGRGCGIVDNIYSDAILIGGERTGGMIGTFIADAMLKVTNCHFDGKAQGTYNIGGILGYEHGQDIDIVIENCLVTADLTSTLTSGNSNVGGICGRASRGEITSCAVVGNITKLTYANGIVGRSFAETGETLLMANCYYETNLKYAYDYNKTDSKYIIPKVSYVKHMVADGLSGDSAYTNTWLDFYIEDSNESGNWVVKEDDDQIALKSFTDADNIKDLSALQRSVSADVSWYNDTDTEFFISTPNELYGLAQICNEQDAENTFNGETIKLATDIKVNTGLATDWEKGKNLPVNEWVTIGGGPTGLRTNEYFDGTFDGQGHTVSGLYMSSEGLYLGMFGVLGVNSVIRDFKLTNTYFECTRTTEANNTMDGLGSIAGWGVGTLDTIYSDAILKNEESRTGGMVGNHRKSNTEISVNNCWFDGKITGDDFIGGIIGYVYSGTTSTVVTNCLVTADLTSTLSSGNSYVGGICGRAQFGKMSSCVYAGTITGKSFVAGIAGRTYATDANPLEITKCYYASDITVPYTHNSASSAAPQMSNVSSVSLTDLEDVSAYTKTLLDFYDATSNPEAKWVLIKDELLLKDFATSSYMTDLSELSSLARPSAE